MGALGGEAADEDAAVEEVLLHPDAVAEHRAAAEWAGGVYGEHADAQSGVAGGAHQPVHQGALASAGGAGDSDGVGVSGAGVGGAHYCGEGVVVTL